MMSMSMQQRSIRGAGGRYAGSLPIVADENIVLRY